MRGSARKLGGSRSGIAFISLLAGLAADSIAGSARADTPTPLAGALDRLSPSLAGDTFFTVPSADVLGRLTLATAATFSYARDPLVLHRTVGSSSLAWVTEQSLLDLQVSAEILERLKLDLLVPVLLTEGGNSGSLGGITVTAPSVSHIGDLRVALRAAAVHQSGYLPAVGLSLAVWAPTGSPGAFAGAGVARIEPTVAIGGEYRYLVVGASVGARYQPSTNTPVTSSQMLGTFGVAARVFSTEGRFDGLTLGPELSLGGPRAASTPSTSIVTTTTAELLLAARFRWRALTVGLAGGPGLGRSPGSPTYRLLAGVGGTFDVKPTARDDAEAAARHQRELPQGPHQGVAVVPVDSDGDGVPDAEDACPNVPGDPSPTAARRGCPPDRDGDGIPDAEDACPDVAGVPNVDAKRNGCPLDTDGDGIPDDKDACPREKGPANADPKKNGCPTSVRVEGGQIVILQQVHFDSGKDTIRPESFDLLGQVGQALRDHPEIARVAVDGHTDNRGGDKPNKSLSERRALAVVRWLIEHGVDARRLEARGFGQRRPIADNATEPARAKNRRVEFLIRKRTELGEKGWVDGPIEDHDLVPPR